MTLAITTIASPGIAANTVNLVSFATSETPLTPAVTSNSVGDLFVSDDNGSSIASFSQPPVLLVDAQRRLQVDPAPQISDSDLAPTELARYNDPIGDGSAKLGQLLSILGEPLTPPNETKIATSHVFMPSSDGANLLSVWNRDNNQIGLSAISRLALQHNDSGWQVNASASSMLPTTQVDGVFNVTGNTSTPWETTLFVESMPADLAAIWNHPDIDDHNKAQSDERFSAIASANALIERGSNPYRYGYLVELRTPEGQSRVSDDGIVAAGIVRHYASGRMQSGSSAVVTDASTLYRFSTDSGQLFRFVAEYPNNLSSGKLWIAQYADDQAETSQGFNIDWVLLGHGNNEEINAWISTYEGMSSNEYTEGLSSYVTDEEIRSWAETHSGRDLDDNGSIDQYIDSRVAFLEPVKAAAALGIESGKININGLSSDGDSLYLSIETDDPSCSMVYRGALDSSGNVNRIQPIEHSLCNQQLSLDQRHLFLQQPGMIFTTGLAELQRVQLDQ